MINEYRIVVLPDRFEYMWKKRKDFGREKRTNLKGRDSRNILCVKSDLICLFIDMVLLIYYLL